MNAVAAFSDQAGQFLRWWGGELAALVPEAILARRKPKPRSDIKIGPEGITIDRVEQGLGERYGESRPIEALDEDAWAELGGVIAGTRPRIVLGVPDIYVASLSLPAAARGRLNAAVSLHLAQVAPLDPSLLVWTALPRPAEGGRISVSIAMARAARVAELQGMFADHGLPIPSIAAEGPDGPVELQRSGGSAAGGDEARANRIATAGAALLLLSIPFTTVAGAWLLSGMAEGEAERISRDIAPRLIAERKAERDGELRRALAVVYAHPAATATVEALALGVPDTDYLESAARAPDGTLQASVDSADADALRATLAKAPLQPPPEAGEAVPMEERPGRVRVELRSVGR